MKIKLYSILIASIVIFSCNNEVKLSDENATIYTGDFAGEPLDLTLSNLDDSLVKGESAHKGQTSEMSGKRKASERGFTYVMKELGTGQYQGQFDFELDTALHIIFGSWQRVDTTNRTAIVYTLREKKLSE